MRFIVPGSIASALPPTLVPCFRGLGLVRFGSLGLITLSFAIAMTWNRSLLPTDNCELTSHFSALLPMAIVPNLEALLSPLSNSQWHDAY